MSYKQGKFIIAIFFLFSLLLNPLFGKIDPHFFSQIKARNIGPATMSGRISDITVVDTDPNIIYVGTATGGVWKSNNGGVTWKSIFDNQSTSSIGAVVVSKKNPNIIWIGTGEGNPRNSSGVGRGVFKSLDAGKTWEFVGLEKTEKIARMVISPDNPKVVYVAALGTTWGENSERGIFKTTDEGKTWEKILYVNERTGAADIAIAPDNPNKLIAAMWEHRRWPWFFKSGGPGSGLYISSDAGGNWKKLSTEDGLPAGELGRCGIAFAPGRPNIVYAEVEAIQSTLLRSEDGGFTWKSVNSRFGYHQRPFYYCDIRVNPKNENIVYSLQAPLWCSEDGGKTFKRLTRFRQVHSDFQAMWLHPDGEQMVVGTDGGIVISRDRGNTWRFCSNIPVGQFYHIAYDFADPYNVYGGLQDNGSWQGPSCVLTEIGILNSYWKCVGPGDGFDTQPDPQNNRYVYGMLQGGELYYTDVVTGKRANIKPTETNIKHRYNWNSGFAIDPLTPSTIYLGSQFVHRSQDKGLTWEIISPDLTTNNPEKQKQGESGGLTRDVSNAENHTTILSIAPSPLKQGIIWVSTDDGNVQLTKDNGKTWQLLNHGIKGVPPCTWAPHVEASKFNPAGAFVVFDDHRRSNWTPYLYMTDDYGKTWNSLVTKDIDGFIHVIEQDPKNENLLFIGTEFGLYFSIDKGKEWYKWTSGLPTAPVRDIAVHPRNNDLIIATHGRSIYILDNITFLRELTSNSSKEDLYLFQPMDGVIYRNYLLFSCQAPGDFEFIGQNPPIGAVFYYIFNPPNSETQEEGKHEKKSNKQSKPNSNPKKKLELEILDSEGNVVNKLHLKPKKGINRVIWNFRENRIDMVKNYKEYTQFNYLMAYDGYILPGHYTARLSYDQKKIKKKFQVKQDPRFQMDINVLKHNQEILHEIQNWFFLLVESLQQIKETKKTIGSINEAIKNSDIKDKNDLIKKAEELDKKLKNLYEKVEPELSEEQGYSDKSALISFRYFDLFRIVVDTFEPLNQATQVQYTALKSAIADFLKEYNVLFETEIDKFKQHVHNSGVSMFKPFKSLTLK